VSSVRALCTPQNGFFIYKFSEFTCTQDAGAKAPGEESQDDVNEADNHGQDKAAWFCGSPADSETPCQPQAPWVEAKDSGAHRLTLKWNALGGSSPQGDLVSGLVVHVSPAGSPSFSTSSIPNWTWASSLTIDNLVPGTTYTFRMYATTNHGLAIGLPLTIQF